MAATASNAISAADVARSFFASYNAHRVDEMIAVCSEDARLRY
jgi:hypothetical protein